MTKSNKFPYNTPNVNPPNPSSKFKTENCVEINDELHRVYNNGSQIKFKTSMLRSGLCDYGDAYKLFKGIITVPNTGTAAVHYNGNKKLIFKYRAPFTDCISEIDNTQIYNSK